MRRHTPLWCAAIAFAVFAAGAARSIQGGDVAELSLVGTFGGVAHPPGYPLWSMLARIAGSIPLGAPVLRLSLLSALCASGCVAIAVRVARRLGASEPGAAAAALALALALCFWRTAGIPEVFALAALLAALVIDTSLTLAEEGTPRAALALGACLGLAAANHHTSVFLLPLAIAALTRTPKLAAFVVLPALAGFLLYAWLPLAARFAGPQGSVWGDLSTLRGFFDHVLRREYGTLRLGVAGAPRAPVASIGRMVSTIAVDLCIVPVAAAIAGAVLAWRTRRAFIGGLVSSLALAAVLLPGLFNVGSGPLAREVESRFAILPLVLITPLAALGFSAALEAFVLHAQFGKRAARAVALVLLFAPVALQLARGWPLRWSADRFIEEWHAVAAARTASGAVILGASDVAGPAFAWVRATRGAGRDVRYLDVNLIRLRWYFDRAVAPIVRFPYDEHTTRLGALVDALAAAGHPVYAIPSLAPLVARTHRIHVEGLLFRLGIEDAERDRKSLIEALAALPDSATADAWSAQQRESIAIAWGALARELDRAGRGSEAEVCRDKARELLQ